jgi:DNA-binding transcriptional regulator YdaS (Cro superfamily)
METRSAAASVAAVAASKVNVAAQNALRFRGTASAGGLTSVASATATKTAAEGDPVNIEWEEIGRGRMGRCRVCIYVMERLKQGYAFDPSSICAEVVMKNHEPIDNQIFKHAMGKDFAACHQVLGALKQWGPSVRQWMEDGCWKLAEAINGRTVPEAELVVPCPSHTICGYVSFVEEEHVFCDRGDTSPSVRDGATAAGANSVKQDSPSPDLTSTGKKIEVNYGTPGRSTQTNNEQMKRVPDTLDGSATGRNIRTATDYDQELKTFMGEVHLQAGAHDAAKAVGAP